MALNSRSKGKRGEYQVRDLFIAHGFFARRGQQFSGSPDSPDVVIPDLENWLHVESKFVEKLDLYKAVAQAERDGAGKVPVVFHKQSHKDWLVTMSVETFFEFVTKLHDKLQNEINHTDHTEVPGQEARRSDDQNHGK